MKGALLLPIIDECTRVGHQLCWPPKDDDGAGRRANQMSDFKAKSTNEDRVTLNREGKIH